MSLIQLPFSSSKDKTHPRPSIQLPELTKITKVISLKEVLEAFYFKALQRLVEVQVKKGFSHCYHAPCYLSMCFGASWDDSSLYVFRLLRVLIYISYVIMLLGNHLIHFFLPFRHSYCFSFISTKAELCRIYYDTISLPSIHLATG